MTGLDPAERGGAPDAALTPTALTRFRENARSCETAAARLVVCDQPSGISSGSAKAPLMMALLVSARNIGRTRRMSGGEAGKVGRRETSSSTTGGAPASPQTEATKAGDQAPLEVGPRRVVIVNEDTPLRAQLIGPTEERASMLATSSAWWSV